MPDNVYTRVLYMAKKSSEMFPPNSCFFQQLNVCVTFLNCMPITAVPLMEQAFIKGLHFVDAQC